VPRRHHENNADAVHDELVGAQGIGPEQPHQDPGRGEHADLETQDSADRQAEAQDTPDLVPAAQRWPHSVLGEARRCESIGSETGKHQPLDHRRRTTRAGNAQSRCPEVTKHQYPIEPGIHRDAEDQRNHHRPAVRGCHEKTAQYGKTEEARCGPGDGTEEVADLRGQRRLIPEHHQQPIGRQQGSDERYRQQCRQNQTGAGDASGPAVVAGADRVASKRRHRGQNARAHQGNREIEAGPEPRGGEGGTAETADDDRVRETHRHLRQICGGQRSSNGDGRAYLRGNRPPGDYPRKKSWHYFASASNKVGKINVVSVTAAKVSVKKSNLIYSPS